MSNIEDVLRQFRPAKEPDGFWKRVLGEKVPELEPRPRRRLGWILVAAAAMLFALLLALVTGPFGGRTSVAPEEALRKIRQSIEASETACIRFTLEPEDAAAQTPRKTGVLFLKRGNKLNLSVKEWSDPDRRGIPETEARLISDGRRMERCLLRRGTEVQAEETKPGALAQAVGDWYLRGGNLASWPGVVDLGSRETIRDVRSAGATAEAPAVSYKVGAQSVTLWYDPVTFKPLRRTLRSEGRGAVTETYQEYEFNEDMPDSLFVLAKEK
jgi:outer membrane lipoprotein-sorting protein